MANIFRGFADQPTHRDRAIRETQLVIKSVSDEIIGDPIVLFQVVAGGPQLWRRTFMRSFRGNRLVTDDIADLLFQGFCEQVVSIYGGEDAAHTATLMLDAHEPVTPPTQKEIDNSWIVDSASSDEGRRHFYGPDGHPEELIKKMVEH